MNESPNNPRRRPARSRDIPMRTKRLIIQEAGGVCPFCGEQDADSFDFHHIHGKDGESPHDPDNLITYARIATAESPPEPSRKRTSISRNKS